MHSEHQIKIFINQHAYELTNPEQTGDSLKHLGGIPLHETLLLRRPGGDEIVANETKLVVKDGEHFHTEVHRIHIFINGNEYEVKQPEQTGASLKQLAGIRLTDVLFRDRPGEDEVIPNEAKIVVKNGERFHSQPPADYGLGSAVLEGTGLAIEKTQFHAQPGGWTFLVISGYELPNGFIPGQVEMLLKLPPGFPDSAPDMFWVSPAVSAPGGKTPKATCSERLLGQNWQRFSWHMAAGAWKPGLSDLRDFLRCIRARFLRLD